LNDFEIPEHLVDRFQEAERTAKKGITTPRITDLMREALGDQDVHRLTKTVGHFEKLLDNSALSNADTERLDPEALYNKVEVVYRDHEKPDIFHIDVEE
jgi:hypothetical protein